MAFWIIMGLVALSWIIAIIVAVRNRYYDFGETSFGAGVATFFILFIGFFVILTGASTSAERTPEMVDTYGLRALVTKEATETHAEAVYFLGFGYGGSDSTVVSSVSYIQTAADGGNTIHKVDISDSVIYEDLDSSEAPYLEDWRTRWVTNGWWIPWTVTGLEGSVEHRFHIPDGSIYEGYEVNP